MAQVPHLWLPPSSHCTQVFDTPANREPMGRGTQIASSVCGCRVQTQPPGAHHWVQPPGLASGGGSHWLKNVVQLCLSLDGVLSGVGWHKALNIPTLPWECHSSSRSEWVKHFGHMHYILKLNRNGITDWYTRLSACSDFYSTSGPYDNMATMKTFARFYTSAF